MNIKAYVRDGRLRVDEPTNLPEGTEVELLPLDPWGRLRRSPWMNALRNYRFNQLIALRARLDFECRDWAE
jgi:hypothetical protein